MNIHIDISSSTIHEAFLPLLWSDALVKIMMVPDNRSSDALPLAVFTVMLLQQPSEPLVMQQWMKYGYHSASLLLHQQGVQIAALLNSTVYSYKPPRYLQRRRGGISVLLNKEAVELEPPGL